MNPLVIKNSKTCKTLVINSFSLWHPTKNHHSTYHPTCQASKVPRASRRRIDTEVSSEIPRAKASHRRNDVGTQQLQQQAVVVFCLQSFLFVDFFFGPYQAKTLVERGSSKTQIRLGVINGFGVLLKFLSCKSPKSYHKTTEWKTQNKNSVINYLGPAQTQLTVDFTGRLPEGASNRCSRVLLCFFENSFFLAPIFSISAVKRRLASLRGMH